MLQRYAVQWKGRRREGLGVLFVCLPYHFCRSLLIWDDSNSLSRQDSQPLCDCREIKRGSLLTFTLSTSPSGFILVFLIINSFCLCWLLFIVSPCLSLISRLEQFLANSTNGALFLSVVITCRAGTTGARDKTDGKTSKRKGWEVKESRKAWWVRQRETWLCVCIRQGRTVVVGQLTPTGNEAAALLGQCAIISFIIITACSSSSTLPLHPSHIMVELFSSSKLQTQKENQPKQPRLIILESAMTFFVNNLQKQDIQLIHHEEYVLVFIYSYLCLSWLTSKKCAHRKHVHCFVTHSWC